MTSLTCYNSLQDTNRVVKFQYTGPVLELARQSYSGIPGTSNRAERTPGAVAVSGVYGRDRQGGELSAGIPWTNSELPLPRGSFLINKPGLFEGCQRAGGGSWSGPAGDLFSVILETVAKRSEEDYVDLEKDCPAGVITGSCANGHRFAREVYCGKEWCKTCNGKWEKGQDMKPTHGRRFARWYPKAQQIDSMGYWTFTIPPGLRWKYRTKVSLTKLGHDIQELLKSYGYDRGLRRWHYFGDRSRDWHAHLNCLVDGGSMDRRELRSLRREYSKLLGVGLAIAEYHFLDSPGQKVHALKYVTRATFLDWTWDPAMARELKGFRNQLWWGSKQWSREPVWFLDDLPGEREADMSDTDARTVSALELGYCPYDGLPISWERFQPISVLPELGGRELVSGYWELPYVRPPPYNLDLSRLKVVENRHRELAKTIGGSYLKSDIALSRWAEFDSQHRRFVANWKWCRHLEEADRALSAKVFYSVKNSCLNNSTPGGSNPRDKTVRMPNCLGSPPVVGEN